LPDGGGSEWDYRLPSFISTFIAQDILVCPNEVAVPREKVCRAVDGQGLVDVHGDKVIISTSAAWAERPRLRWRVYQTFDSIGVIHFLGIRKKGPDFESYQQQP
jgi:hypothetical protein